ncbi:N-6 DNA methylase [Nocardia sp. NBC_01730]|uniref:N-6 DNA methylase n=1 Tax=Nocardia sp. NBC_01730 TaxID=2975998 RepID=UPI002E0E1454|nr:N-6 DNA methylase [Nocardia sp. NBC_01730]
MSDESGYVTLKDIADRAEVRLSAVSNWRTRHADFPKGHTVSGREVFEIGDVARWLQRRKVPRNRLKPDERADTSYADRVLRNAETSEMTGTSPAPREAEHPKSDSPALLWAAANKMRGTHDTASSLELLLGLVYVKTCHTDIWRSLIESSDWLEFRSLLEEVSIPLGADTQSVPVFRTMKHTPDPSLIEAAHLIDQIDFSEGGPESTPGRIGEAILANLERDMGRSGGYFTPPDVARCLVELIDPSSSDHVYDPACGSGELLSAAAIHANRLSGSLDGWQVYGQTPLEWSWLTSRMNLALHGIEADLSMPSNALIEDRFPERRFSRIIANPPFNLRVDLPQNRTWPFGDPPSHNANFAWLQHVVTKLEPMGRAAVLMPAGAAFARSAIRGRMVAAGVIECVIALPRQLFRFTSIATMVWILRGLETTAEFSEMLFIDARDLGEMVDRTERRLSADDIKRIVDEYNTWRGSGESRKFTGNDGFSRAVDHEEISENNYNLEPAHYVSTPSQRPDTAQLITELGALRNEFDDLSKRADTLRTTLEARLAAVVAGHHSSREGQSVRLETLCDVLPGPGTVSRSGHEQCWIPLVLPRNINNNRIGYENLDVVPPAVAERMARYRLVSGDIVTARAGTLGRYGRVLEEQTGWLLGPGCVRLRPKGNADADYLTYYLSSPIALDWLMEHATGSAIQHVNAATMREMPIWLPSLTTQRTIIEVLDPFHRAASTHNQISTNTRKLHNTLLAMLMSPATAPEIE